MTFIDLEVVLNVTFDLLFQTLNLNFVTTDIILKHVVFNERFCAKYFNFKGRGLEKIMEIYSYAYRRLQEVSFSMESAVGDDDGSIFGCHHFH